MKYFRPQRRGARLAAYIAEHGLPGGRNVSVNRNSNSALNEGVVDVDVFQRNCSKAYYSSVDVKVDKVEPLDFELTGVQDDPIYVEAGILHFLVSGEISVTISIPLTCNSCHPSEQFAENITGVVPLKDVTVGVPINMVNEWVAASRVGSLAIWANRIKMLADSKGFIADFIKTSIDLYVNSPEAVCRGARLAK